MYGYLTLALMWEIHMAVGCREYVDIVCLFGVVFLEIINIIILLLLWLFVFIVIFRPQN